MSAPLRRLARLATVTLGVGASLTLGGCSILRRHPTAPEPPPVAVVAPADTTRSAPSDTTQTRPAPRRANGSTTGKKATARPVASADSVAAPQQPVTPLETMDPEERARTLARTVADTTSAGQAMRHCSGRAMMPDQQATLDAVRSLLAQTRAALASGELWRAESLARKARQLASSLNCP